MRLRIAALVIGIAILSGVQALQTITRAGKYLYQADGTRFYIKGVAYQQQGDVLAGANNAFGEPATFTDPLASPAGCQRDLPFLQKLGVNIIHVYSVNSSLNHDECMKIFDGAGIYAIVDLPLPGNGSINRQDPQWTIGLQQQYLETINIFSKYDNILAFNVGNEIVTSRDQTIAGTFVKAAVRDVKAYLTSIKSTALVTYHAVDGDPSWVLPLAEYLTCDPSGTNSGASGIDIYGLNNYRWCTNQNFEGAYAPLDGLYSSLSAPSYFSEVGCPKSQPSDWSEVEALFSSKMSPVWTGGIAFSFFPASSGGGNFGLVTISNGSVTTSESYDQLKTQYGQASPPNSPSKSGAGSTNYPTCPPQSSAFFASTTLPPTPNLAACACLQNSLSCRFNHPTSNDSRIVASLLDSACALLAEAGGSCSAISANGTNGTYGMVSGCDPITKLSFVMNQYYISQNDNPQACSFGGNGTVNVNAPTDRNGANAAASSCLASATGTSVPTLSGGSSTPTSHGKNGAAAFNANAFGGILSLVLIGVVSGIWTLLCE